MGALRSIACAAGILARCDDVEQEAQCSAGRCWRTWSARSAGGAGGLDRQLVRRVRALLERCQNVPLADETGWTLSTTPRRSAGDEPAAQRGAARRHRHAVRLAEGAARLAPGDQVPKCVRAARSAPVPQGRAHRHLAGLDLEPAAAEPGGRIEAVLRPCGSGRRSVAEWLAKTCARHWRPAVAGPRWRRRGRPAVLRACGSTPPMARGVARSHRQQAARPGRLRRLGRCGVRGRFFNLAPAADGAQVVITPWCS